MNKLNYEISILVGGKKVSEYLHEDETFIEGRDGSEYTIQIKNNSYGRIEAVVSVDGLSVIDGKEATNISTGYIVNSYATIEIPGWRLDSDQVAKFVFGSEKKSYSNLSGKGTDNTGIIGLRVFSEKVSSVYHYYDPFHYHYTWHHQPPFICGGYGISGNRSVTAEPTSATPFFGYNSINNCAIGGAMDTSLTKNASNAFGEAANYTPEEQLGTAFGDAANYKTTNVSFIRNVMEAEMSIFYDTRKNLEKRGIIISKPVFKKPIAFKDTGCVPPKGWTK